MNKNESKNKFVGISSINQVAEIYLPVVEKFKTRYDVQNGYALGYHYNHDLMNPVAITDQPKGFGDGTTTTGYCVSASQALLNDKVFQFLVNERNAFAKLVSIDIQRRFHGVCYTGSQNKWHTAIYVKDAGLNMIIDLTCGQFGNSYIGKLIWDLHTWLDTFRSPTDQHQITDFDGNLISPVPVPDAILSIDNDVSTSIFDKLHDIINMSDEQRTILSKFLTDDINNFNAKILIGNITKKDFEYLENINGILRLLDFIKHNLTLYAVFKFKTQQSAQNWVKLFFENKCITPGYIIFSNSIEESCKHFSINQNDINLELTGEVGNRCIVLKLVPEKGIHGIDVSDILNNAKLLIPYGIKLSKLHNVRLYNSGLDMEPDMVGNHRKTNTTIIEVKI
jgi:hypothetical protein